MANALARVRFAPKLISVAVASCFAASVAIANPTGPAVVHGTAAFHQSGNLLQVTNSPSAIINWQSFSIGASEITRFIQQSAASAVLNRVITQDPSVILGALQSNGRVFLINPNGILFGAGAQVDVAGLVASTLNLSNTDFLAGRMKFTEVPGAGSVVNQGSISTGAGGQVYLVGPSVRNEGIITSPKGEVILAAGNSVELVNPGSPNLRVEISAPENEAKNLGTIVADAGRIGIYAGLINHSGTIRADSAVATEDGRIVLKATKSVTLEDSSVISASGAKGGEILVLAGDTVQVAGRLDASAPNGGDGGFIETSADKVTIRDGTVVTTAASFGKTGTWLIDPVGGVCVGDTCSTGTIFSWNTVKNVLLPASNATITTGAAGEDITVQDNSPDLTSSNKFQLVAHDGVTVNGSITNSGGGTLALYAGWCDVCSGSTAQDPVVTSGPININAPITMNSTSGEVHLVGGTITQASGAPITANKLLAHGVGSNGTVSLTAPNNMVNIVAGAATGSFEFTNNKSLTIGSVTSPNPNVGTFDGITVDGASPAQIVVNVTSGNLTVNENVTASGGSSGAATVTLISVAGNIAVNDSIVSAAGGAASEGTGGNATVTLNAGAGITVSNSSILAQGGSGSGGGGDANVTLISAGNISMASTVSATGGAGSDQGNASVTVTSSAGDITNGAAIEANGKQGSITMSAPQGFIHAGSGSLKATSSGPLDPVISLTAKNGIGTLDNPIRIDNSGDADVILQNTGTTGDIAVSLFNNPSESCTAGSAVCIDDNVNDVLNANPTGTYFVRAEDGAIHLDVLFLPGGSSLQAGQSVIFEASNGDIVIGPAASIIAGAGGGTGNVSLMAASDIILLSTPSSSSVITGSEPLLKANEMDIQGFVRSGSGFINIRRMTAGDIHLGLAGAGGGVLALDNSELGRMTSWDGVDPTAGSGGGLVIGAETDGAIVFKGAVDPSAFLNVRGTTITQDPGAAITGGLNVIAPGGVTLNDPGNQINYITTGGGLGTGAINLVTGVPLLVVGVTTTNADVNLQSSGDISFLSNINAGTGAVTLNSTGGAIVDNHTTLLDILASSANLTAASGIGSIANPIETQVGTLSLNSSGGEIGVINHGNLTLASLLFGGTAAAVYASTQFGAASGTLTLGSDIDVDGNLSLLSDTGMTVNKNVFASGSLVLDGGAGGNLNVLPASYVTVGSLGTTVLAGSNVNIGSPSQTGSLEVFGSDGLVIGTPGNLSVNGGSATGASTFVWSGANDTTIVTGGNVSVNGGSASGAFAHVMGFPDVVMGVGGTVAINASTSSAPARIESGLVDTINIEFPNRSSGGFFVNGVENAVFDSGTASGFFANGSPAVLGQNLVVTYGGSASSSVPQFVVDQVVASTAQQVETLSGPLDGGSTGVGAPDEEEKKKDLPVCR